jgi:hypothetical protein
LPSLAGCAARQATPALDATRGAAAEKDEPSRIATLHTDEEHVLELLAATDPRFAARVGGAKEGRLYSAAVKALAAGDTDAAIEDGALDFFSFNARTRSLDEADAIVAHAPTVERDADAKLERELLVRLVAEERARLDEERVLPRGASALVRGLVETWGAPESRKAAQARDARISRRLDEVRASLEGQSVSRVTLAELDDALDPLERIATPGDYATTAQALARLRVALGDATSRAEEDDASWPRLQLALRAHLGLAAGADELRTKLERGERSLRAEASSRIARSHPDERSLARRADALTLAPAPCTASARDSRLRALPPPPERAPLCGALAARHDDADDASHLGSLAALVALHDDVVVALWSLALHEAHATPNHATDSAHPFFGAQPDREARLVRFAAARPVAAIAAGLAAAEIAVAPESDLAARWLTFGDAPLDLALAALGAPLAFSAAAASVGGTPGVGTGASGAPAGTPPAPPASTPSRPSPASLRP